MNIHFVGCEGVSMKVLSRMMQSKGHNVTGSDITLYGHNAANIDGADLVVYTSAVGEDNAEVMAAKKKGIPLIERAQFLGEAAAEYENVIAIAGSHGKTTATGFTEQIFLPLDPTVHIGGKTLGESGHIGGNKYFISEACEYKRSFLHLRPDIAVILNIELDHTDYYKDYDDYFSAFNDFVSKSKTALVNGDDSGSALLGKVYNNCYTFGLGENNFYRAVNIRKSANGREFDILKDGGFFLSAQICVSGVHNVYNALAAAAAADLSGVTKELIGNGLKTFTGVKRRFEYISGCGGGQVYTDYAHHPSEIKTTVQTAREKTDKKVTLVFEPHTYSRTKSLCGEFIFALAFADRVILCPIFAAREAPIEGVTSHILKDGLLKLGKEALHTDTFEETAAYIKKTISNGEIVVFTGAGDIYKAAELLKSGGGYEA